MLNGTARSECCWGEKELLNMPTAKYEWAEKNIKKQQIQLTDISNGKMRIRKAKIAEHKVIVLFGVPPRDDGDFLINAYDLEGNFLYGYFVSLDYRDETLDINVYNDSLLLYVHRFRCIYKFYENGMTIYDAPNMNEYYNSKSDDDTINNDGAYIVHMKDGIITIENNAGKIITIADCSDEYDHRMMNRIVSLVPALSMIVVLFIIILVDYFRLGR